MEYMATVPDKYFDLAIVDPPYRNSSDNQPTKDMRATGKIDCFGDKPSLEYFKELFRVTKNWLLWGINNFAMEYKGYVVWRKLTISDKFTMSMCEIAGMNDELGTISKYYECAPQDPNRIHPTQKPVALYKWLLKNYATPEMKIFDSHGGSFSSAIACYDFGTAEYVGCELDKDYYDKAVERYNNHIAQINMFNGRG